MKQYKLKEAASLTKRGPSGIMYFWKNDQVFMPANETDQIWCDMLCAKGLLVWVDDPASIPQPLKKTKISDLVSGFDPNAEEQPVRVSKSREQYDAEVSLSGREERNKKFEVAEPTIQDEVESWLTKEAKESVVKTMTAIENFLGDTSINLTTGQKVEYINKYIENDMRETVHKRVKNLVSKLNLPKVEETNTNQ